MQATRQSNGAPIWEPSKATSDAVLQQALERIEQLELTAARLGQFVPSSARRMIERDPAGLEASKVDSDVTILFLDVEGYTLLGDILAPAAIAELIEGYFSSFVDVIHELGGDINETAGDGMMVLFQDDRAPSHAQRAVSAALAVLERTQDVGPALCIGSRPLVINMGISSGMASVGLRRFAGRIAVRCTYTATGAVTNTAARLQAEAKDGWVLVSEETARRVRGTFELCDLGYRKLHNLVDEQRIFRVLGRRSPGQDAVAEPSRG